MNESFPLSWLIECVYGCLFLQVWLLCVLSLVMWSHSRAVSEILTRSSYFCCLNYLVVMMWLARSSLFLSFSIFLLFASCNLWLFLDCLYHQINFCLYLVGNTRTRTWSCIEKKNRFHCYHDIFSPFQRTSDLRDWVTSRVSNPF